MAFNLQKVLKALLFAAPGPLTVKDIQAAIARFHQQPATVSVEEEAAGPAEPGSSDSAPESTLEPADEVPGSPEGDELYGEVPSLVTAAQIREAMDAIAAHLQDQEDVYLLMEGHAGYRLVTHPRYARWVRILREEPAPVRLSQSALETLAIIAYRQPVTRAEIEAIRGVSAEAGVNKLLERELIYIMGRAELPGRPLQYGTTEAFLEMVGIRSVDELPSSDVLSPRQIDTWLSDLSSPKTMADADVGLDSADAPLEENPAAEAAQAPAAEESVSEPDSTGEAAVSAEPEAPAESSQPEPSRPSEV